MRALLLASVFAVFAVPAYGQTSAHNKTPPPPTAGQLPDIVIIQHGKGGRLDEHYLKFGAYKRAGAKVQVRGPCYSACTLVTAYIDKADLCIAEGAFLAFHAVRSAENHQIMRNETALMYHQQPVQIQRWIDRMGGFDNLPLDGYWTMYDRNLWAMGYAKCP